MTVRVQHPDPLAHPANIRGQDGPGLPRRSSIWIGADTWQWVYLLDTYPAVAQTGQVHLHIHRKPGSPNQRGFQGLLEGTLC